MDKKGHMFEVLHIGTTFSGQCNKMLFTYMGKGQMIEDKKYETDIIQT
jgi:hypothetical protein